MLNYIKHKKVRFFVVVSLFFFSLLTIFVAFFVPNFNVKPNETNTFLVTATITNIEIKNNDCIIHTVEYGDKIKIDKEKIDYLNNNFVGKNIIFRIEKTWESQFEEMAFLPPIVYLKIENNEIITLESYNQQLDENYFRLKITGSVFAIIFMSLAIYLFITIFISFRRSTAKKN